MNDSSVFGAEAAAPPAEAQRLYKQEWLEYFRFIGFNAAQQDHPEQYQAIRSMGGFSHKAGGVVGGEGGGITINNVAGSNSSFGLPRPGDWQCPTCRLNNYSTREVCHRCMTPKGAQPLPAVAPSAGKASEQKHRPAADSPPSKGKPRGERSRSGSGRRDNRRSADRKKKPAASSAGGKRERSPTPKRRGGPREDTPPRRRRDDSRDRNSRRDVPRRDDRDRDRGRR
jgi:hypothetical protein